MAIRNISTTDPCDVKPGDMFPVLVVGVVADHGQTFSVYRLPFGKLPADIGKMIVVEESGNLPTDQVIDKAVLFTAMFGSKLPPEAARTMYDTLATVCAGGVALSGRKLV